MSHCCYLHTQPCCRLLLGAREWQSRKQRKISCEYFSVGTASSMCLRPASSSSQLYDWPRRNVEMPVNEGFAHFHVTLVPAMDFALSLRRASGMHLWLSPLGRLTTEMTVGSTMKACPVLLAGKPTHCTTDKWPKTLHPKHKAMESPPQPAYSHNGMMTTARVWVQGLSHIQEACYVTESPTTTPSCCSCSLKLTRRSPSR